jgi:hypothetical protein
MDNNLVQVEPRGSSGKFVVQDQLGGFTALQYTTSSSVPGTLELTNSYMDIPGGEYPFGIQIGPRTNSSDESRQLTFIDELSGRARLYAKNDGELIAENNSGQTTTLT